MLHWLAYPVPGIGIAVPVFFPAVATAVVALLLSREFAAPLAYVGGSLGTLIGADLSNLDKVRGLGAPVASIGGAAQLALEADERQSTDRGLAAPECFADEDILVVAI